MNHSLFSASASERWIACPGAVQLCKDIPERRSAAADEGSALHTAAEHCLRHDENPREGTVFDGMTLTLEHVDLVQVYLDYARKFNGSRLIEQKINYATPLGLSHHLAFGTCDLVLLDGTHMHVIDAKFGRGPVSAFQNKQMTLYAAGFAHAMQHVGRVIQTIDLHIVQPRVTREPKPFSINRDQLHHSVSKIRERALIAHDAMLTINELHPNEWSSKYLRRGDKQCRFCPARGICPAW